MKTAAAYVRVSTDDQLEFSPDSQIKALENYAQRNDMRLPKEFMFIDEGISGKTTNKREQFNAMIALAKTKPKPFDVILVWKYSRFARNREDSVVYKSMLRKELGIDVVSISEDVGDDKMSIIFEAMIEAMDEYYSINLAEEVKRGMTEKAKRGGVLSIPPYGYTVKDGVFVQVPREAQIIKKVFTDYINGDGFLTIAKALNDIGITTHRGNKIENRTIEYWLNNPVYIGKIRWNPVSKTSRNYRCKDLIIEDGQHEPIIPIDMWERVQQRMAVQKEIYRKYQRDPGKGLSNWCTGLIRCGVCGGTMGNMAGVYQCGKKYKGLCEGNGSISAKKLNRIVIEYLEDILNGRITNICAVKRAQISSEEEWPNQIDTIKTELAGLEVRLQRVKDAYECGIDTIDEYKHNKEKIHDKTNNLKKALAEAQKNRTSAQRDYPDAAEPKKIKKLVDALKDDGFTEERKNEYARKFIKEIVKCGYAGKTIKIVLWK